MIEFYEDEHRYTLAGRELVGVTSTLKAAGILQAYGDAADLERGREVHRMCHLHFDDRLNVKQLPSWLFPFFEGLLNFRSEIGFEPIAWEEIVYSPKMGFAGRLDVRGMRRGSRLESIVDFKSGAIGMWTAIQTAAYSLGKPCDRMAVGLGPGLNGGRNYQIEPYPISTLAYHYDLWLASMKIANYKKGRHTT